MAEAVCDWPQATHRVLYNCESSMKKLAVSKVSQSSKLTASKWAGKKVKCKQKAIHPTCSVTNRMLDVYLLDSCCLDGRGRRLRVECLSHMHNERYGRNCICLYKQMCC